MGIVYNGAMTQHTNTGQYSNMSDFGLMYYNARWYDPYLNRWVQPDSIIPDPGNPQDRDRYSYTRNNPMSRTDPTGHCDVDPYDQYYDYECHHLALQISKAESQGNSDGFQSLYSFYDAFKQDSLQLYYDIAVKPYLAIQYFTARQAELVALGEMDDVQALQNILDFSLSMAGGNLDLALTYAASAFYRDEVGRFGGAKNYRYTNITEREFGVSGFNNKYVGVENNTNQLEHFIGEAHIMSRVGGSQWGSEILAWLQDKGNASGAVADRELGYVAAWWISQPSTVNTVELVTILRTGVIP